jgi:hypothetical protein
MMGTLKVACEEDILKRREELEDHFTDMINLSIECSLFIAGYSSGSYYRKLVLGYIVITNRKIHLCLLFRTDGYTGRVKQNNSFQRVISGVRERVYLAY